MNVDTIRMDYTFGGEKIKKVSPDEERVYVGGVEYKNNTLEFLHIPNGRIIKIPGSGLHYQYFQTDYLGNTMYPSEQLRLPLMGQ